MDQFRELVETGLKAHKLNDFSRALEKYKAALVFRPNDPGLLGLLGMALHQSGNDVDAKVAIQSAIEINPHDPRLHNYLGQVLNSIGQSVKAQLEFVEAIRLDNKFMEAWFNAGNSLLSMNKAKEAIRVLERARELAPSDSEVRLSLLHAYYLEKKYEQIEISLLSKVGKTGLNPGELTWLYAARQNIIGGSDYVELNNNLSQLTESSGVILQALLKIGKCEIHHGRMEAARFYLTKALEYDSKSPEPYAQIAVTKKFTDTDKDMVEAMMAILPTLSGQQLRHFHFALGKIFSDLGKGDKAFYHYKAGNDIVREYIGFDSLSYGRWVDKHLANYSATSLHSLPKCNASKVPILVVGTPRSGTTLTESIISSHSAVVGAGEIDYWPRVAPHLEKSFPGPYSIDLGSRAASEYINLLREHSIDAIHIVDKMPQNFLYIGLIHAILPNARFIHIRRHPIDACLSMYFQDFQDGLDFKWDLHSLAFWYVQYQKIMEHWRKTIPNGIMLEFWYEDLVDDTEGVSRKIMDFLGLEWEPGQLEFHKKERSVFTASKWQVRQPIYKSSKERWRIYENHLGPLLPLLKYARKVA